MSLSEITRNLMLSIKRHSPEILTGMGIAGMLTTVVMAVKVTPKAMALIDEKKKELEEDDLVPIEVVKTVWTCYIPAALTSTLSIACLIGASSANLRRNAALATAYSISESALKEYQEKVIETIGQKKEAAIHDSIAKDQLDKHPMVTSEVIVTGKGNTYCFDVLSGRYFYFDIDDLKKIVNELNRRMLDEMYVSVNDLYYELGLVATEKGDDLGWNITDGFIDLKLSSQLTSNDVPCLVISYRLAPRYDYRDR